MNIFKSIWEKGLKENWDYNKAVILVWLIVTTIVTIITSIIDIEIGLGILISSLLYIVSSIRVVDGDKERAGVLILGTLVKQSFEGGLILVPLMIGRIERLSRQVIQRELPAEPEQVWNESESNGSEKPPTKEDLEKFKLPIRVTFEDNDPKIEPLISEEAKVLGIVMNESKREKGGSTDNDDPLRKRVTTKVTPVMSFSISNVLAFLQEWEGSDAKDKLTKVEKQLEDIVTTEVKSALQIGTCARALSNMDGLSLLITSKVIDRLYAKIVDQSVGSKIKKESDVKRILEAKREKISEHRGLIFHEVRIKDISPSWSLNKDLQEMAKARAKKVSDIEEAEGKAAIIRQATAAEYMGQAEGLKALKKADIGAKEFLALKAVEKGMKEGTLILGGEGINSLMAAVTAISEANKNTKNRKP